MIVSSIHGRLRIRDPQLKDRVRATEVARELSERIPGCSVHTNPATASALITFVDEVGTRDRLLACLGAFGLEVRLGRISRDAVETNVLGEGTSFVLTTGMLLSLGASLSALVFKAKRVHALAGAIFVGLGGVHYVRNRRKLGRAKVGGRHGTSSSS